MKRKKNEQFVKHKMFYLLHVFLFFNKNNVLQCFEC